MKQREPQTMRDQKNESLLVVTKFCMRLCKRQKIPRSAQPYKIQVCSSYENAYHFYKWDFSHFISPKTWLISTSSVPADSFPLIAIPVFDHELDCIRLKKNSAHICLNSYTWHTSPWIGCIHKRYAQKQLSQWCGSECACTFDQGSEGL